MHTLNFRGNPHTGLPSPPALSSCPLNTLQRRSRNYTSTSRPEASPSNRSCATISSFVSLLTNQSSSPWSRPIRTVDLESSFEPNIHSGQKPLRFPLEAVFPTLKMVQLVVCPLTAPRVRTPAGTRLVAVNFCWQWGDASQAPLVHIPSMHKSCVDATPKSSAPSGCSVPTIVPLSTPAVLPHYFFLVIPQRRGVFTLTEVNIRAA